MRVRAEQGTDRTLVYDVNTSAFGRRDEADLVDALRARADPVVSLVAEVGGAVVGHVLFSPARLGGRPELLIMGLAPLAVEPRHQRRGVGAALVRAGLQRCRELGVDAVVVLGHPAYYPRFGFAPARRFGIGCDHDAPEDAFMALELQTGVLAGATGTVQYHNVFRDLQ